MLTYFWFDSVRHVLSPISNSFLGAYTMKFCRFLVLCAVAAIALQQLHAQEEDVLRPHGKPLSAEERSKFSWANHPEKVPFMVGIEAGMNYNMFSQDLSRTLEITDSPNNVLKSGSGISPFFGLLIEEALSANLAIQLKFMYDTKHYSNKIAAVIDAVDSTNTIVQDLPLQAEYVADVNYVSIAPTLRYNLSNDFFVTLGVNYQFMSGELVRNDKLTKTDPENANTSLSFDYALQPGSYSMISRSISKATDFLPPFDQGSGFFSSPMIDYSSSRTCLEVGAGYLVDLTRTAALALQARYQFAFSVLNPSFTVTDMSRAPSNRSSDVTYENAMLHSLQLSLGLWFKIM